MGDHNVHNKKEVKKQKQGRGGNPAQPAFSSRPVFTPPPQIKKEQRES